MSNRKDFINNHIEYIETLRPFVMDYTREEMSAWIIKECVDYDTHLEDTEIDWILDELYESEV